MQQKVQQIVFPVKLVVAMAVLLSLIVLVSANPSLAATGTKQAPVAARASAVDHVEARIKELQGSLQISKDQEKLWDSLTTVMRENAKEMDVLTKDMRADTKPLNAIERMKLHNKITEVRLGQQNKLIPVFEELYESMSDKQKKITDTIFVKGPLRKHKKA
jgi:hypothetical protein